MKFDDLGLLEPILRAVQAEGYHTATPIQAKAIPEVMQGRDLMGCAQTGTGKTAAFALPTLQRLFAGNDHLRNEKPKQKKGKGKKGRRGADGRKIRALILSPTRELAAQIADCFSAYGRYTYLRHTVVYGGVSQVPQVRALRQGVDTLIATPGRLLDLVDQGHIDLSHVEVLILDEADRMLDMGFVHDLKRIVAHAPRERQTLMFSATMPKEIRKLASEWLSHPVQVQVAPDAQPAEKVDQSVYLIEPRQKLKLLTHFLKNTPDNRSLVFTRTKHGADKIVRMLDRDGIRSAAIHGNKSQAARQRVLKQFKTGRLQILVATDIAARGLDVDDISHVINYDMPLDAETYVHRIGRTGRAGADGIALSFCGRDERPLLRLIERLIRKSLAVQQQPEGIPGTDQSHKQSQAPSNKPKKNGKKSQSSWKERKPSKAKPEAPLDAQAAADRSQAASESAKPAWKKSEPAWKRKMKSKGQSGPGRNKKSSYGDSPSGSKDSNSARKKSEPAWKKKLESKEQTGGQRDKKSSYGDSSFGSKDSKPAWKKSQSKWKKGPKSKDSTGGQRDSQSSYSEGTSAKKFSKKAKPKAEPSKPTRPKVKGNFKPDARSTGPHPAKRRRRRLAVG